MVIAKGNQKKHNIKIEELIKEPYFPEIWKAIEHYFEDTLVIFHNKGAELSYFSKLLINYNLYIPSFRYIDSYDIFQCNLPEACEYFGVDILHHHNALEDAICCAECCIKYFNQFKQDINEFISKECNEFDSRFAKRTYNKSLTNSPRRKLSDYNIDSNTIKRNLFKDRVLYLSGNFDEKEGKSDLFKAEIKSFIQSQGGKVCKSVNTKTSLVILGERDAKYGDTKSNNHKKAEELSIPCIDLDIFLEELKIQTTVLPDTSCDLFSFIDTK